MITRKIKIVYQALIWCFSRVAMVFAITFTSCSPDVSDDPIPPAFFNDIRINLNLPQYLSLRTDGGHALIDGGVRGIILYRKNVNEYLAYEQNCSYQPNNACATVNVHVSNLYMEDPCCNSMFSFTDGQPTGGPAWRPLRRYYTSVLNSELTITQEVVE